MPDLSAIVVLGCRAILDASGRLRAGALEARLDAAARLYALRGGDRTLVVASGGRCWEGAGVEADVMGRELAHRGVPERAIVRERCSLSTRENARFVREVLARRLRSTEPVALVTNDWHMPRAGALFRRAGLVVEPVPAAPADAPWHTRVWRRAREGMLVWLLLSAAVVLGACSRRDSPKPAPAGAPASGALAVDLSAIEAAEDRRSARRIPAEAQRGPPAVRRRAARALARILDGDDGPLLRALGDEDPEVVAWAGYGLGESCGGGDAAERAHVRALAARLASLEDMHARSDLLGVYAALVRALGRCGGDEAEQTLRAFLQRAARGAGQGAEAAAYALGDIASRRGALSPSSAAALLDAAQGSPPVDAALYAFGRAELAATADLRARLLAAARAALARPGPARIFSVRALGRSGSADAAADSRASSPPASSRPRSAPRLPVRSEACTGRGSRLWVRRCARSGRTVAAAESSKATHSGSCSPRCERSATTGPRPPRPTSGRWLDSSPRTPPHRLRSGASRRCGAPPRGDWRAARGTPKC